jgi:glycolate oxidase FAD binding subunit
MSKAGAGLSRLASIVGASHVAEDAPSLADYSIDSAVPKFIVRPGSVSETAEVVKLAGAEKLALVICGARTKLSMGMPPRKYDLALDVSRLDKIVQYDPGDLTLSVEAGIPLSKLATALAENGQFLPLAVPWQSAATIGGTIASGVDSPLRQFYGTARDFALGMEFITGDGSCAKSGGRVVKNVTGYDLHKLMIGAMGTLGVITQIHFRTFPAPRNPRAVLASFDRFAGAWAMRQSIADSPLRPMTLDVLSPGVAGLFALPAAARNATGSYNSELLANGRWVLTTGFSGNENVLNRYAADLKQMAEQAGATSLTLLGAGQIPGAFARKREFIPIALESSPATVVMKLSILPGRMSELLAAVQNAVSAQNIQWAAIVRGIGVAHVALLPENRTADALTQIARVTDEILSAAAKLQGNASIPWCPAEWKTRLKVWGIERSDFAQMKKLKAFFDPSEIFAPGRFVGGI